MRCAGVPGIATERYWREERIAAYPLHRFAVPLPLRGRIFGVLPRVRIKSLIA